jgi:diguanylate cyclase (GGDEF)-like protein
MPVLFCLAAYCLVLEKDFFAGIGLGVVLLVAPFLFKKQHFHTLPQPPGPIETPARAVTTQVHTFRQHTIKMSDINLSVIGMEYRRKEQKEFETTIDGILDICIQLIAHHIDAHTIAFFFQTDDDGIFLRRYRSKTDHIFKNAVIKPGVGVIGSFLKEGFKELTLNDIVSDSTTLYYYTHDVGVRSLIASPIIAENAKRGAIIIDSLSRNYFTEKSRAFLATISQLCGLAVYHAYMFNQRRLDYERLLAMSSTEKYFFKEHSIDAVLDKLIEIIPFSFQCDRVTISLPGYKPEEGLIQRVWGIHIENLLEKSFPLKEKSLANILYTKNICFFRNFSSEHYEMRYFSEEPHHSEFKSFLAFPLGVDECKGMILLESLRDQAYSESSRELLSRLVWSAGIAIEKIQILKQTENLAIRDGLTGLYNRRQFQHMIKESITRSIRFQKPLALVMCDIDHFKSLNDTYGHRFGDLVLKEIASKLQSCIREGIDTSARYGGEEFTLILSETDATQALETVERIRQQIANILFTTPQGSTLHSTMSFGIAMYGTHAKNQDMLIRRADKALYKAKENGRNRVEIFMDVPPPAVE